IRTERKNMTGVEKYVKFSEYPKDERFAENIRKFQGCPTIAVTKKGRIFMGWYSGGTCEPNIENYNLVIYSDDEGETWSEPVCVIESSKENRYQALDIQLWTDPEGALNIYWVQNNAFPLSEADMKEYEKKFRSDPNPLKKDQPLGWVEGWCFDDFIHHEWLCKVKDPDADILKFEEPKCVFPGFLRCRPLVLKNKREIYCAYNQANEEYLYTVSDDRGKSYVTKLGAKRIATDCDETMCFQKENGDVVMLARTKLDFLAKTVSKDNGETWSETCLSDIPNPMTRFYIGRTPRGRLLMVNNHHKGVPGEPYVHRTDMTVLLSEDEGETWKYKKIIDRREQLSYPDVDFYDGKIYLTYDRERMGAKEIYFLKFTEEDIMNPDYEFDIKTVSKPCNI
ncbi:MAG: exo-alpha-sialidase, partial [Armatimonadetes bacterium]|nr:exo-alpha-sialidase [Candidatus Hippobium faecium]